MKCAEFQIVWMKGLIHRPGGTAVEFNRFGTNGLSSLMEAQNTSFARKVIFFCILWGNIRTKFQRFVKNFVIFSKY